MKLSKYFFILLFITFLSLPNFANGTTINEQVKGKILLQVEENGEAWYIYPQDNNAYYLGRPKDAFDIMRELGLGISNNDLLKLPIGLITTTTGSDSDNDGLSDLLEESIGTNANNHNTDHDEFDDKQEIENGSNPLGGGNMIFDTELMSKLSGRILLQVESKGEAWYINPTNQKRYYLGRPENAWQIMRTLGLGISNKNLALIKTANQEIINNNFDKTVLVVLPPVNFYETEFNTIKETLHNKGINVKTAAQQGIVTSTNNTVINVDFLIYNIDTNIEEFDALVFVDNFGSYFYAGDTMVHELIQTFSNRGRIVASVDNATLVIANAGMLFNTKATASPNLKQLLIDKGAEYIERLIVAHKNIITVATSSASKLLAETIAINL